MVTCKLKSKKFNTKTDPMLIVTESNMKQKKKCQDDIKN